MKPGLAMAWHKCLIRAAVLVAVYSAAVWGLDRTAIEAAYVCAGATLFMIGLLLLVT